MDVQHELNPYQSPASDSAALCISASNELGSKRIYLAWLAVFVLNLGVPLWLGWSFTEQGGRSGLLIAAIVLFVIGYWLCANARRVGQALVVGGVAVSLTQVFPALQMMAGIVGFFIVEFLGLESDDFSGLTNDVSGFVVTLTTGGLLMAAALTAGLAIRALFSARRRR